MKTFLFYRASHLLRLVLLTFTCGFIATTSTRAGLTLEMNLVHYNYQNNYYYYFSPYLNTNSSAPAVPFGTYYVVSPGFPTNGATALYQFDANGFNQVNGGSGGFSSFDAPDFNSSFIKSLTNGQWTIFVTNAVTTNTYYFNVTANISSNDLPIVTVTSPAYGAVNVTNQPTFTWHGPTNYSDLAIYQYNYSSYLPVTQTSLQSPNMLYQGLNDFTAHYDSNSVTAAISSTPLDSLSHPISSWVSTAHLQTYFDSQFTVGTADTSGTAHTLVAHYPFDATSGSVLSAGTDTSGNGYDISFGGSYGSQGGVNLSADSAAGAGAVQFHDGDGNSAGYLGWSNPTPPPLLSTLAGSFSISCWIKTSQSIGNDNDFAYYGAGIISADNNGQANDVIPLALTGSKIGFNTGGDAGDVTLNSTASVNDGNYHHIVVTRNQQTGQKIIYIDGIFDSFSSGTTSLLSDPQKLTIGALADAGNPDPNDGSYYNGYDGELDDVQIYSGVLSGTDVAALYANPGTTTSNGGNSDFAATLNTTNLNWNTGGDLPWFSQTDVTEDGLAAQSGAITNSQSSYIQTTVPADGQLSFDWKVSSEDSYDYLTFYINGNEQDEISGEEDWNQETYTVSAGDTLRWEYSKDGSHSDGLDAGFLDKVNYIVTPLNTNTAPVITLNPFSQTNYPGYNVALLAAATSNPTATWQWFKVGNASPIPNATNALFIPTNSGTAGVAGSYYAIASNFLNSAITATAVVSFVNAPLPPDWSVAYKTQIGNNSNDDTTNYNIALLLDATGTNIYTVGSFTGTNSFGPDTLINAIGTNGNTASSFLKQTIAGTAIWGRAITNNGNGSSFAQAVAAAPGGGIYAAGDFFGTNWLGTNLLVDVAGGSTFLTRFDANGNVVWVQTFTGTNSNFTEYHDLASDPAGNVTVSALISGGTRVATTNVFVSGQAGLIAQFDASGNLRWLQLPSGWPSSLNYNGGAIYGTMGGNTTNYIGGVTNISDRHQILFSINATNGQGNWLNGFAAQKDQGNPYGFADDGAAVAVSGTNIFVAGMAWGSNAVFGPFPVSFPTSKGCYLARYDTNGNPQLATTFGSEYTWVWSIKANASGNVYIGCDFDTYAIFGNDILAAPFYDTVQSLGSLAPGAYIPGQTCVAKFDRNGNPLWARLAESQSSHLNSRDIAGASDGVWSCGFFNQQSVFGTITINGGITVVGSPIGTLAYHPAGYLAKITDGVALALPVSLLNPLNSGANFQFQFLSQSGFTHNILYRTTLPAGNWQTNSTVTGDGTVKTISLPFSLFSPSKQGFIRVSTQ